ncbi:MAG: DUF924 family protein [Pseudomonadota bacterium]
MTIHREGQAFELLETWWSIGEEGWYKQSDDIDAMLKERYSGLLEDARSGKLDAWKDAPHTALALILCLDQLPRNIYRGTPEAFSSDADALWVADYARARGFDKAYTGMPRNFFYMPYMHSEELSRQDECCDIFRELGNQHVYYFALIHMDAIRRFGRFPHRNAILGRETTEEEQRYMSTGGFSA